MEFLENNPANVKDLAEYFEVSYKVIENDLSHLRKSLHRRGNKRLLVKAPECISCQFVFRIKSNIKDPKKCPECHNERIVASVFKIEIKK